MKNKYTIRKGFCPICNDRIIDDKGKIMPNQRQYKVILTEGHTTHLAVCKKHNPDEIDFSKLTDVNLKFIVNDLPKNRNESKKLKSLYQRLKFVRRK